ncbi:VOC family protein [Streptomyces sporangiiformans]|uniref:VOC family protein n=1 Tax=Streptomyces sporangiiformans TaxID=2315329 RepID=A0A505CVR3_9ACTN|nr:VOC family protein [Streptomyces sporangiiformans]TPQ15654.1 VOC family protein [Streptomyces sporangiiformans]
MLGTDFTHGSPCWIDLGSPDTDAATAFYGGVFGWQYVSAGPEAGGYGFFQKDGSTVAAMGRLTEEGASSAWTVYFRTDDIQATVDTVERGGGTVRVAPMEVMGEGRMAQLTDQQGAQFAVLQPGETPGGLEKTSEDNTLLWVELHVPDPVAGIRFYRDLFGWRSAEMQAPGMTYRVLSLKSGDQQATSFGGVAPLQEGSRRANWVPYFAVADADDIVRNTQENGGSVLMPAADVPDVGRIAWLTDTTGAVFAVLKPNPRQG